MKERNCMSLSSTHVYACVKNDLCVQLLYFSHTLLVLSFLPLLYFFPGATGCCLKPFPDMCCHLLWSQKLDQNTNIESQKSQAFAWYLYTSSSSSSVPLHLSPLYPTHSALRALSSGEVVWLYIIHGSCDVRHVSYGRSNKMEYRREYEEQHSGRHKTLSPVALHSTLHFKCACWCTEQLWFVLEWKAQNRTAQQVLFWNVGFVWEREDSRNGRVLVIYPSSGWCRETPHSQQPVCYYNTFAID